MTDAPEGETLEAQVARLTASRDEWAGHAARWQQRAEESAPAAALWDAHQAREAEVAPLIAAAEARTRTAKEELFALRLMWERGVSPSLLPLLHGTEEERIAQAEAALDWRNSVPRWKRVETSRDDRAQGRTAAQHRHNPQETTHAR